MTISLTDLVSMYTIQPRSGPCRVGEDPGNEGIAQLKGTFNFKRGQKSATRKA